eukprot:gene24194-31452_t
MSTSRVHLLSSDSMDGDSYRSSNMPSWATGSFEQNEGIRRVLECTSTGIQIVNGELKKDHVIYEIHVCCGFKRWAVYRRYKDFCFLDQQLRKLFAEIMPALPPKRIFRSSTDPEFVDERRIQLESYLKALVGNSSVWTRNDLALFLDNDANYLMLIWYFERMRRMQDMLSSMTIMNEEEKATLNSDLTNAKRQVNKLQERLSVMEMTFLQHATGMASEALPSSVMRSLSGADNSFLAMSLSNRLQSEVTEEHKSLYDENVPSLSEFVAVQSSSPFAHQSSAGNTSSAATRGGFVSPSDSAASSFTSSFVQDSLLITKGAVETVLVDQVIREHVTSGDKLSSEDVVKVLSMASDSSDENIVRTRARLNSNSAEDVKNAAFSIELKQALLISEILGGEKFDITDSSAVCSPSDARSPLNRLAKSPNISEASPLLRVSLSTVSYPESELYAFSLESLVPLWLSSLLSLTDQMIAAISPNKESLSERLLVYNYLRSTVSSSISLQLFPVGSFVTNTYLPDSNLNTSAFMVKKDDDAWFVRLNEALCMSIFGDSRQSADKPSNLAISNVSFVNQDKKMIKSLINNVSVDVSMNQIGALYNESLIESVNHHIGRDDLFKKSIILIKAWGRYESPRHTNGSGGILCASKSDGRLTSWTLIVMLMWVFNSKGETIYHPLQALGHFLRIFSSFQWDEKAVTVNGPADANDLTAEETIDSKFIPISILSQYSVKPAGDSANASSDEAVEEPATTNVAVADATAAATTDDVNALTVTVNGLAIEVAVDPQVLVARPPSSAALFKAPFMVEMESVAYERGFINIIDPIDGKTNLCNEVDETGFIAIVNAFQESYKLFQHLCDGMQGIYSRPISAQQLNSEGLKMMKTLFLNTYSKPQMKAPTHSIAVFKSQDLELEYSLRYAEFVLGGKINHDLLLKLVVQIISKKGAMPVGEVGKNLQSISGCEALSRRLKEQFGGLKKAIESANHPKLQVGTDHPFNPTVTLVEASASPAGVAESDSAEHSAVESFAHLDFVLSSIQVGAQGGSNGTGSGAKGDIASTTTKNSRTYRRPPPYIVDSKNNYSAHSNYNHSNYYDSSPSTASLNGKPGLSNNAGSSNTAASRSRGPNYHPAPAPIPGAPPMNRMGPQQQSLGAIPPNYPH